jgi:anaerobic selenocysteine-containing dehydrogenase
MNQASYLRVMSAASSIETKDAREAAILGGLVTSLVKHGKFDMQYARHACVALLDGFAHTPFTKRDGVEGVLGREVDRIHWHQLSNRTMPLEADVKRIAEKFRKAYEDYEPPTGVAA